MTVAIGCGSRSHSESEETRLEQAQADARHWAARLVEAERTDTAALQECILEAKAVQSSYLAVDDDDLAEELSEEFDNAYRDYLEEHAPELAREIFR